MGALSEDIEGIFQYLEVRIEGYGYLKWNEVAMMKADMMNVRRRWLRVDVEAFRARCLQVGMTNKETAEMVDYLRRTQAGRRLVPDRSYRDFSFAQAPPSTRRHWSTLGNFPRVVSPMAA